MNWIAVVQGIMVTVLAAITISAIKFIIPAGMAIRDGLRDTASELASMRKTTDDHETRLREIERNRNEDRRGDVTERRHGHAVGHRN